MTMNEQRMKEIEERAQKSAKALVTIRISHPSLGGSVAPAEASLRDVPDLVAEVRRLNGLLDEWGKHDAEIKAALGDDRYLAPSVPEAITKLRAIVAVVEDRPDNPRKR